MYCRTISSWPDEYDTSEGSNTLNDSVAPRAAKKSKDDTAIEEALSVQRRTFGILKDLT